MSGFESWIQELGAFGSRNHDFVTGIIALIIGFTMFSVLGVAFYFSDRQNLRQTEADADQAFLEAERAAELPDQVRWLTLEISKNNLQNDDQLRRKLVLATAQAQRVAGLYASLSNAYQNEKRKHTLEGERAMLRSFEQIKKITEETEQLIAEITVEHGLQLPTAQIGELPPTNQN